MNVFIRTAAADAHSDYSWSKVLPCSLLKALELMDVEGRYSLAITHNTEDGWGVLIAGLDSTRKDYSGRKIHITLGVNTLTEQQARVLSAAYLLYAAELQQLTCNNIVLENENWRVQEQELCSQLALYLAQNKPVLIQLAASMQQLPLYNSALHQDFDCENLAANLMQADFSRHGNLVFLLADILPVTETSLSRGKQASKRLSTHEDRSSKKVKAVAAFALVALGAAALLNNMLKDQSSK